MRRAMRSDSGRHSVSSSRLSWRARACLRPAAGRLVLGREHAPRQRAVGHHAHAIGRRRRKLLGLGAAVDQVVQRLAGHGPVDALGVGQVRRFGDAPSTEIRHAEIAQLAGADQVADGAHGLAQRGVEVGAVEVQDVEVIGAQPAQAAFHGLDDPLAGCAPVVGALAQRVGELGGQHPVVAVVPDGAAHDFLGAALLVDVGGVDEVDAPWPAR